MIDNPAIFIRICKYKFFSYSVTWQYGFGCSFFRSLGIMLIFEKHFYWVTIRNYISTFIT